MSNNKKKLKDDADVRLFLTRFFQILCGVVVLIVIKIGLNI